MTDPKTTDCIQRFLLEDLDIHGAHVHLSAVWQKLLRNRNYPANVTALMGELTAITTLISANLKQEGRLTFQLKGDGQIPLVVLDCTEALNVRAYASLDEAVAPDATLHAMLGDGQLLMTLDMAGAQQPFQSFVPIEGDSVAEIFRNYLELSEQQAACLVLAADDKVASGIFLQKLPGADQRDADGWSRILQLANTLQADELKGTDAVTVLTRLFHEETVRVFEARPVTHDFPANREKIETMLRSLGRGEIERILAEHGEVSVHDDLSNHTYVFSADEAIALFTNPPTLH